MKFCLKLSLKIIFQKELKNGPSLYKLERFIFHLRPIPAIQLDSFRNAIRMSIRCSKNPCKNGLLLPKYSLFFKFFYRQTNSLRLMNLCGPKIANKYSSTEAKKSSLAPQGADLQSLLFRIRKRAVWRTLPMKRRTEIR